MINVWRSKNKISQLRATFTSHMIRYYIDEKDTHIIRLCCYESKWLCEFFFSCLAVTWCTTRRMVRARLCDWRRKRQKAQETEAYENKVSADDAWLHTFWRIKWGFRIERLKINYRMIRVLSRSYLIVLILLLTANAS